MLSTNAGRAVTYDSLLRQAWGKRKRGSAAPKLVRAIVRVLRGKLDDDAARPAYVCNVRGVGYRNAQTRRAVRAAAFNTHCYRTSVSIPSSPSERAMSAAPHESLKTFTAVR